MEDDRMDRLQRLLFPGSDEEWERAKTEQDAAPIEPGRYKVVVPRQPRSHGPIDIVCPDCGKVAHSSGGISFSDLACDMHGAPMWECIPLHVHWMESCKAPHWVMRRFWVHYGLPEVNRRWMSWRWKRRSAKERADPGAWVDYWGKGGK